LCIADEFLPQGASSDDEETIAVEESNENESGEQWQPYRHWTWPCMMFYILMKSVRTSWQNYQSGK